MKNKCILYSGDGLLRGLACQNSESDEQQVSGLTHLKVTRKAPLPVLVPSRINVKKGFLICSSSHQGRSWHYG